MLVLPQRATLVASLFLLGLLHGPGTGQLFARPAAGTAEQSLTLRWGAVRGAFGYVIELKDSNGSVRVTQVVKNEVVLKLVPGDYLIRLAGLNKFRKPGLWSEWRRISIAPVATAGAAPRGPVDLDRLQSRDETRPAVSGSPADEGQARGHFRPAALLPGLVQWQNDERFKGSLFAGAFFGATLYARLEYDRARAVADDPTSRAPLWMATLSTVTWDNLILSGVLMRRQMADGEARFSLHRANYRAAASLAVLVYVAHIVDLIWSVPDGGAARTMEQPGWVVGQQFYVDLSVGPVRILDATSGVSPSGRGHAQEQWVVRFTRTF